MADCSVIFCNIHMTSEVPAWKQSIDKQVVGFTSPDENLSINMRWSNLFQVQNRQEFSSYEKQKY